MTGAVPTIASPPTMTTEVSGGTELGSLPRASILRVWEIVNRHYESTLSSLEREDTSRRAAARVSSLAKELRDLTAACTERLDRVEARVKELKALEFGGVRNEQPDGARAGEALGGEWHFVYTRRGDVFGYMRLIPETLSRLPSDADDTSLCGGQRAEFTLPTQVAAEARRVPTGRSGSARGRAECPRCGESLDLSEFWRHAVYEIAERGARVPARRPPVRSDGPRPRWTLQEGEGWDEPIYRPRDLTSTCEIGECLSQLNLKHFLSDDEFSGALDRAFELLALRLRS
uniref:Uncharacterized protein n=1 Tax=Oryzias latipes TaxID=8090 RepID=A0A286P9T5_ORYLA|nr:hypothetical protein [Oryzias latipes]